MSEKPTEAVSPSGLGLTGRGCQVWVGQVVAVRSGFDRSWLSSLGLTGRGCQVWV